MDIGARVRAARKARGLSQERLARHAGVSLNVVSRLERGEIADPHASTLTRLAFALGEPVGELMGPPVVKDSAAHMGFKLNIKAHPEKAEKVLREVIRNACLKALAGGDMAVIEDEAVQEFSKAA